MSSASQPTAFEVEIAPAGSPRADGGPAVMLRGEAAGDGPPIVLLHGVSATRREVLQGSRHLVRSGYRLIGCDARGHGASDPAPEPGAYEYGDLVSDLVRVLDRLGLDRPVIAGSSMGAATAIAFALTEPDRVAALVQITPAYDGAPHTDRDELAAWDRLAEALEDGGVDAFVEAAEPEGIPERWRETARTAIRQRMMRHDHPAAVAEALRVVPRSAAFDGLDVLERIELPTLIVGSRDEADALHPLRVARAYAERLPRAELIVEEEGESPLAWRGAQLSRAIAGFLARELPEPVRA